MNTPLKLIATLLVLLLLLMVTTAPAKLPSLVLIVPFVLIFCILSIGIAIALGKFKGNLTVKRLRRGAIGAITPVLLLIMRSLGQLTFKDLCIIAALFGLGYFYVNRMSRLPAS